MRNSNRYADGTRPPERARRDRRIVLDMPEPVFMVHCDPAPESTLEAFNEGKWLTDDTGCDYLRKFLEQHHFKVDVDYETSPARNETIQESGIGLKPRQILTVRKIIAAST